MPTAPFMHAAHWVAFDALLGGNTVVIQDGTRRFDAASILATAEREKVNVSAIDSTSPGPCSPRSYG